MGEVKGQAVIYARFSPRRNADECESIETQVEACRAYCEANGLAVVGEYEDREKSGGDIERPGLWQAVDSLQRGWVLVVYKLDRLCRSVYLAEIIERAVAKRRARIVSISGEGATLWLDKSARAALRPELPPAALLSSQRVLGPPSDDRFAEHPLFGRGCNKRVRILTPSRRILVRTEGGAQLLSPRTVSKFTLRLVGP